MGKNYEVPNAEIEAKLKDIGRMIKADLPEGWGFALQIFSYGEGGSFFYLSSAERGGMIKALKEFIGREEKKL